MPQIFHLGQQPARIHHHAVADDASDIRVQDARRHEVKGELLGAMHHPVPGVAAALVADDIVGPTGQLIDDFAFAFIAPLGANNRHHAHRFGSFKRPSCNIT